MNQYWLNLLIRGFGVVGLFVTLVWWNPVGWGRPEEFAGPESCIRCHGELARLWLRQKHSQYLMAPQREVPGKGCEECHGPAKEHVETSRRIPPKGGKLVAEREIKACLSCHERTIPKVVWSTSPHGREKLGCSSCHEVHRDPKGPYMLKASINDLCLSCHRNRRNEFRFNSHHPVLEGRLFCTDCHSPHGEKPRPKTIISKNTLCLKCHRDKSGPFLFEHEPVVGELSEGCRECHRPHGSGNPSLLKIAHRGLCLQCHTDKAVGHFPGLCWSSGCHSAIHGSNNSNLFFLK